MPQEDYIKDYKMRLILYREWQQNTAPDQTVKIINSKLGDNSVTSTKVLYYFNRFNKSKNQLFSDGLHVSSGYLKNSPKNPIDLPFLMTGDDEELNGSMNTNDGRFLLLSYVFDRIEQRYFVLYDLFRDMKRKHVVPFKLTAGLSRLVLVGQYLLAFNLNTLHVFKINFDDLDIKELKTTNVKFSLSRIILDQLDENRFVICDSNKFIAVGRIQDDGELVTKNVEKMNRNNMIGRRLVGKRLVGNKLKWFTHNYVNNLCTFKFCEIDVETMEMKENDIDKPIKRATNEFYSNIPIECCWSGDYFYGFYKGLTTNLFSLLMFDSINYKWTDLKVFASKPKAMFVDRNQCLTLETGNTIKRKAYYRIALGKPDKLMNLTLLFALRESKLFENNKYLNITRQLNF